MGPTGNRSASSALLAIAAAFAVGVVLAKCIDWMGHGHPKQ
jgi:hypothetical protein